VTTVSLYTLGGVVEFEDSEGITPTVDVQNNCVWVYAGPVVTFYPLSRVLWCEVDYTVVEHDAG
jgi:hypothetical protein